MRIVIDLQGAQSSGSRFRGIGRYSLSLAQAMAREARGHEIWIALNGLFPDSIQALRVAFDGLVPQDRIVVWQAPGAVADIDSGNRWRREAGECLREAFLAICLAIWVEYLSMHDHCHLVCPRKHCFLRC